MKTTLQRILLPTIWIHLLAGCAYTANLSQQSASVSVPMVSQTLERPLYLVLEKDDVANAFPIEGTSHSVEGFRDFIGASLRKTLHPYFREIVVATSPSELPDRPHWVGKVRVDGIKANELPTGGLIYVVLDMQWAFAIRPSERDAFLFSYAGNGKSEFAYRTLDEGCQQLMRSALTELMKGWTERDVYAELQALESQSALPHAVE